MNELVKDFFQKAEEEEKQKAAAAKEKQRKDKDKILIENGLFTEERVYMENRGWGEAFYDQEKKQYYKSTKKAVEVSDEEYARILEIINKKKQAKETKHEEKPTKKPVHLEDVYPKAEKIMHLIIKINLIVTILSAIVIIIGGLVINDGFASFGAALGIAIVVVIVGILVWASSMVIINISNNLHNLSRLNQPKE